MPGRWYTELFDIAAGQYGYVTTDDVHVLGGKLQVLIDMHAMVSSNASLTACTDSRPYLQARWTS